MKKSLILQRKVVVRLLSLLILCVITLSGFAQQQEKTGTQAVSKQQQALETQKADKGLQKTDVPIVNPVKQTGTSQNNQTIPVSATSNRAVGVQTNNSPVNKTNVYRTGADRMLPVKYDDSKTNSGSKD